MTIGEGMSHEISCPGKQILIIIGISSKIEKYRMICGTIKRTLNKNRVRKQMLKS
jgi:hypothetical protein